ncbi:hypothetical protein RUM44_009766 [Polyplax serrata]|uniref:phosphatidylinositol-3,4-bisphosphate 4-phosphatase n=1 Tax=Polyplax serrata TaxID=468196 RepID=A0ABR1ATM5_POLSC
MVVLVLLKLKLLIRIFICFFFLLLGTTVNLERWCRLRGNLLFYFKSRDQWSEPLGVIVLEQCTVKIDPSTATLPDGLYGFFLVFDGGITQYLAATTDEERTSWLRVIQQTGYDAMRLRLQTLQEKLELKKGQDPHLDVDMWRLQKGNSLDPSEVPICEVSISCDNLLCDGHGRPPNPVVLVHVFLPIENVWIKYAKTEVITRCSNPCFLSSVAFRNSDGLTPETRVRLTALDVREKVSQTAAPLGQAIITMSSIQESQKLRIPLRSSAGTTVGFLTMIVWNLELEEKASTESTPSRAAPLLNPPVNPGHRRSQSLPPRLSTNMKFPRQGPLTVLFANPTFHTYRFHSGLGGDISVHEIMAESKLCFLFPQQLLGVWIQEEKELLQEVSGMGELREPWHSRQIELLDRHLQLLHLYSQAQEHLQSHKGGYFKPSARKHDRTLEFAPVNLHLQRMWAQNDSLKKCGFYDFITVGAFTAHSHKSKNGGLIKLLQNLKESPTKGMETPGNTKTIMANDAVQAIKQLRREVVDRMKALMKLAREKQTTGMLPICDEMINRTRTLLSLWDSGLVEEALSFFEENKVIYVEDGYNLNDDAVPQTISPYRRITEQLKLEFKSTEVDELVTPDSPCNQWDIKETVEYENNVISKANVTNINYQNHLQDLQLVSPSDSERQFVIFPECEDEAKENKTENELFSLSKVDFNKNRETDKNENFKNGDEVNRQFLDTQVMCSSPSANYYKPTDEPEPWDLTQLNIEASVMCLVSKVKFLCGRCSSPAVRLRGPKGNCKQRILRSNLSHLQNGKEIGGTVQLSNYQNSIIPEKDETPYALPKNMSNSANKCINGGTPIKNGQTIRNKFTEGLDFDSIADWTCELRPSMKKLRQAMDGLLKTARLTHSIFRVQEDRRNALRFCNVRYRRDVCFSQALTSLVTGLMARLWCQKPDPTFLLVLTSLGPLASFEGLLSYHGDEIDMWGDMTVAIEDLATVKFILTRHFTKSKVPDEIPVPRVIGTRAALTVLLPVSDAVHSAIPLKYDQTSNCSFHVTPVFFNVGINEMATLADSLGNNKQQDKSNVDNFERLNLYYHRFKKLAIPSERRLAPGSTLLDMMESLRATVHTRQSKNVQILHLSEQICHKMKGLRFTSCKSAKDRTGMSVTLEEANILVSEYDLAEHEFQSALDCMRSEGCRRENTVKNTGIRKYAINSLQNLALPRLYRPPTGTYGSNAT